MQQKGAERPRYKGIPNQQVRGHIANHQKGKLMQTIPIAQRDNHQSTAQQLAKGKHKDIAQIKLHTAVTPPPARQQSEAIKPIAPAPAIHRLAPNTNPPIIINIVPITSTATPIKIEKNGVITGEKQIIIGITNITAQVPIATPTSPPNIQRTPPTNAYPETKTPAPPPIAQSPLQKAIGQKKKQEHKLQIRLIGNHTNKSNI